MQKELCCEYYWFSSNELNKIRYALFVRILHLLNEVFSLFVNNSTNPVYHTNQEVNSSGISSPIMDETESSNDNLPIPLDSLELLDSLSVMTAGHAIQHSIDYAFASPVCFAYITHLFTLVAAILDQPIIYPQDFVENYPKLKLMDIFTRDLSPSDRSLAVCILNRNIFSLGSRFNLYLTPDKHALHNLKSLFDHFQNSKFID
ncbi:unnamed protein product [Heterobilharzia americana]|nr:unnamed protein product [Heterobilharzia americana]